MSNEDLELITSIKTYKSEVTPHEEEELPQQEEEETPEDEDDSQYSD